MLFQIVANSMGVRVVLDTNILISACWTPDKLEARVVALASSGQVFACASREVWAEYEEVLFRDKFAALRGRAEKLLADLKPQVHFHEAPAHVAVCADDDDNRFLECAAAASADYLITGNLKHYPARWMTAKVVNAREFLSSNAFT